MGDSISSHLDEGKRELITGECFVSFGSNQFIFIQTNMLFLLCLGLRCGSTLVDVHFFFHAEYQKNPKEIPKTVHYFASFYRLVYRDCGSDWDCVGALFSAATWRTVSLFFSIIKALEIMF